MKELITCPRSKQKSSKRLIALVFCAASVILSFTLAAIIIFYPTIAVGAIQPLSTVIIVFAGAATGVQATTMTKTSKIEIDRNYAEPTSYTDR